MLASYEMPCPMNLTVSRSVPQKMYGTGHPNTIITWTFDGFHFLANRMQQYTVTQQTALASSRSLCRHLATFKLTHEILNALNNKVMVCSNFCDLEKAFDSVNHSLLIKKIKYYGITGKSKLLLESYSTDIKEYNLIIPSKIQILFQNGLK